MNNLKPLRYFSVAALAMCTMPALATLGPTFFTITATNASGSGSFTLASNDPSITYDNINDFYQWSGSGIAIMSGPNQIALLESAVIGAQGDPQLSMSFDVVAGSTDTTFSISSTTLSFGPFLNPQVAASNGVTLTDRTLPGNGATLAGNNFIGDVVTLDANGGPFLSGISGVTVVPPNNSNSGSVTTGGLVGVAGSVFSMAMHYDFVLSAGDAMSPTGIYVFTPEPATLSLLALGGLLIRRR